MLNQAPTMRRAGRDAKSRFVALFCEKQDYGNSAAGK
jgi:hypothetical protein